MENKLNQALNVLNDELKKKDQSLSLVICGAFAIYLQGFERMEQTQDIDSLKPLSDDIRELVSQIGQKLSLSDRWLNDQASDLILPKGALERTLTFENWDHIQAEVLCRQDLIALKASAFFSRGTYTFKDWEDLKLLKPDQDEMEFAISYMKEVVAPGPELAKKFHQEFEEVLDELRQLVK